MDRIFCTVDHGVLTLASSQEREMNHNSRKLITGFVSFEDEDRGHFFAQLKTKDDLMVRAIPTAVICLVLISANVVGQDKSFKNKTARAAQKAYDAAIARAKREYVAKLDVAIKEAGGAGDLDEANLIAEEKKNIGIATSDPFESLRRRMIGTKWNNSPNNRKNWLLFLDKNAGADYRKQGFTWFVMGTDAVVYQYTKGFDSTIYIFKFDENFRTATGYGFNKHSKTFPVKRLP